MSEEIPINNSHVLETEAMEEMLDAFDQLDADTMHLDSNVDEQEDSEQEEQNSREEQIEQEEEVMRKLARLLLYEGAKIYVLRALLAMLNLQSIFGWSDTSVSALFK